jgi:PKD repeat protein
MGIVVRKVNKMKDKLLIIIVIAIAFTIGACVISTYFPSKISDSVNKTIKIDTISLNLQTEIGDIIINAPLPASPATVSIYKGYYDVGGRIEYSSPNWTKTKKSIPSVSEAPALAEKALILYGGIPSDAVITSVSQTIGKSLDPVTLEFVPPDYPESTTVGYSREINEMPVVGAGQGITVDLGENGELLFILKKWRTLEKIGDALIIDANRAIEKLQQGDVVETFQNPVDITVTQIKLGYYEGYPDREESVLEPVWIFYGTTSTGNKLKFFVDARESGSVLKFANFTASPTYGKAPLTVTFTDTSTSNVWDWYWDFGDGSSSTQKNPVHTYLTNGQYTVSLRVADEVRLDTMTKTSYILTGKKAIVMHIDTKLNELKKTLTTMNIPDGNKNSLMQKLENAKAKNGDALKFIDQNKETQANNMLIAEDNLVQAFVNEVNAQAGKAIPTEDAAKLNVGATEIRDLIQKAIETPI